jgi:hypothetical protein
MLIQPEPAQCTGGLPFLANLSILLHKFVTRTFLTGGAIENRFARDIATDMENASKPRATTRLITVAIILLFGGLSYPLLRIGFEVIKPEVRGYFRRVPFDSAVWQDQTRVYSDEAVRKRMLPSLLHTHALVGDTPEELRALLGPPMERREYTCYAERLVSVAPNEMVYWIGPEEGFMAFDSLWLILTPGKLGTIDHYRVTHAGIKEVRKDGILPECR